MKQKKWIPFSTRDEKAAMLWSAIAQIRYFDKHDGFIIKRIEDNRFDENDWTSLIRSYGLFRGKGGAYLANNFERIWPWLSDLYYSYSVSGSGDLQSIWVEAVRRLQNDMAITSNDPEGHQLFSATSKILWFFHPTAMTMYDRYACAGLQCFSTGKIVPSNFLATFESLFDKKRLHIREAIASTSRESRFERRVLDQYLWLIGSGKSEYILTRFKTGLRDLPIQ